MRQAASSATASYDTTSLARSRLLVARARVLLCVLLLGGGLALFARPASLTRATAIAFFAGRFPRPAAVVRRVEAGALVVHSDGKEDLLDRARPARLARLGRGVAHPLEHLEGVPVGAAILVDRHQAGNLPATLKHEAR